MGGVAQAQPDTLKKSLRAAEQTRPDVAAAREFRHVGSILSCFNKRWNPLPQKSKIAQTPRAQCGSMGYALHKI
jgi:hypothetical protein